MLNKILISLNNTNAPFIWIPKNGGTSITKTLVPYGMQDLRIPKNYSHFTGSGMVTFGHADPQALVKEQYLSSKFLDSAFTFAFVRNPWDRLVSLHKQSLRRNPHPLTFEEYVKKLYTEGITPLGAYKANGTSIANPQIEWLKNIKVDFIGRYENLEKDFQKLCKKMNIPDTPLRYENRSIRSKLDLVGIGIKTVFRKNGLTEVPTPARKIKRRDNEYRKYYNDETRNIATHLYKEDWKKFNYSF